MYVYVSMYPCIHESMYLCMYLYTHVCMYTCMYICMHIYMYVLSIDKKIFLYRFYCTIPAYIVQVSLCRKDGTQLARRSAWRNWTVDNSYRPPWSRQETIVTYPSTLPNLCLSHNSWRVLSLKRDRINKCERYWRIPITIVVVNVVVYESLFDKYNKNERYDVILIGWMENFLFLFFSRIS